MSTTDGLPPSRRRVRSAFARCLCSTLLLLAPAALARGADEPGRPNIVFILADDLGYGDVACFGQTKILTPNIDRIAAEGLRLTQHYSGSAVCAPSRCVLMTGLHPGHAFIRDNREWKPEGQYPIPSAAVTLAELLAQQGYVTGAFGKWGLGGPDTSGAPLAQGIQRFFGYNCQRIAHNYYPAFLWDNDRRVPLDNPDFSPHQRFPEGADPNNSALYERYRGRDYAPDRITEAALQFIRDNRGRPFFLYFPSTIPHLALQVPDDSLRLYRGQFAEEPYLGDRSYLPHPTPRAAYAAMIHRLDRHVGQILNLLDDLQLADRTIVVFSSDNGPLYNRLGGTDTDFFQSAKSYRGRKGSLYEGGIRVPTIVRWTGRIAANNRSDQLSGFEDWLPTLLELAGNADAIPPGLDGVSLAPLLLGHAYAGRTTLYREFPGYGGQQAGRIGKWKAVRQRLMPPPDGKPNLHIELYDLATDPQEMRDVSADHPELVGQFEAYFRAQHVPSELFPIPALDQAAATP